MDAEKISEKNGTLKLLLTDVDTVLINSLRRAAMSEVKSLAAKTVSIYENSSIMPDEMLVQRIGMLPIKSEQKKFKEDETVKLVLEKEGPCTVYSRDIKSTDPKVDIIDKKVPIVKLNKSQKIKVEIDAMFGTGKEHVKWQPVIISYKHIAEIDLGKECNLCKDCIDACSKKLLETKGKNISLKDEIRCDLCGECKDACKLGQLKVRGKEKAFLLNVESMKTMENSEILESAIEVLEVKTEEFRKALKDL